MATKDDSGRKDSITDRLSVRMRNLPHWQHGGCVYFITFRLRRDVEPSMNTQERSDVKSCALFWNDTKWTVHMLTVMPDHVHIIATPLQRPDGSWYSLSEILKSVKGYSARLINRCRDRRGSVWQQESFDRIIRDDEEMREKARYVLLNAVQRGLSEDGWSYDGFWFNPNAEW